MTLLKNQVVQAQCPGCRNVLRIPASWVGQMMRCKKCAMEFQAKPPKEKQKQRKSILAKALQLGRIKKKKKRKKSKKNIILPSVGHVPPAAIPVGMPAPPPGMPPVPVGLKAGALPAAIPLGKPGLPAGIPVGMPPPPPSANAFSNINDGRVRRRGGGKQKLAFLFIFLLAIGGLGAVIYSVSQQQQGDALASVDTNNLFPDPKTTLKKVTPPPPPPTGNTFSTLKPILPKDTKPPIEFTRIETTKKQPPKVVAPTVIGEETRPKMPVMSEPTRPALPIPVAPVGPSAYDNMPRRMIAIVPVNYYYANSISTGSGPFALGNLLSQFAAMMRIPPRNIVAVSDRQLVGGQEVVPPIKPVIELNLGRFLDSCRPHERIVVLFMGHAVEIDGVPYLMPLEGEKDKADDLIPLDWLYMRLARCSARQKVLLLDVCRFDPTKGEERGKVEPMGLAFDAMLQNPPPGVQVFTSCSAGQYSYEIESNSAEYKVSGGIMLSAITELRERLANANTKPEDPVPIDSLAVPVVNRTKRMAEFFKLGTPQTPRFYGTALETGLAHDPSANPPEPFKVELAGIFKEGVASKSDIRAMFTDIAGIPPVKREGGNNPRDVSGQLDFDNLPPFAAKTIDPYKDDGKTTPLRTLIREGVDTLAKKDNIVLNLGFLAPAGNNQQQAENQFKANIENTQKQISLMQYQLTVILDDLKALSAERDKETKRWQANFDYVCARLEARIAYLLEYNAQLGNIRKEFPPRDPALHRGWQLASREKISDRDAAKNHKNALKYLEKIAAEHGGTPWAMLAKREKVTSLGLDWVPWPR